MEDEFIDSRNIKGIYEHAVERMQAHPDVSARNKEILMRFLRDGALGKTVIGRAKKKLGLGRLYGCLLHISMLMHHARKDLDQVTQEDMEAFIHALESGHITSRSKRMLGPIITTSGKPLQPSYQRDVKVTIRKFYKWLSGDNKTFPSIVEWIDTRHEDCTVRALSAADIERMLDRCKTSLHRAFIQLLFDGGFRVGELLNVRLYHVTLHRLPAGQECFFLRAPYSKTMPRTVATPMQSTTKWLKLWLEDHPARPSIRDDGTLQANDERSPLFPITDTAARTIVNRAGKNALKRRVYPHLLRHSSATYWANKLPYFKFCKRFGWTMTSDMPKRYIDSLGVDELETAQIYHDQQPAPTRPYTDAHAMRPVRALPNDTYDGPGPPQDRDGSERRRREVGGLTW